MDITTQAVADTAVLHLKSAKGDHLYSGGDLDKPVQIIVYGPGAKEYAAVEAKQTNRILRRREENDGRTVAAAPDVRRKEVAEDLAAITVGFVNLTYPPAGNAQGAALFEAVYADPKLGFIVNQVSKFIGDFGNFLQPSNAS